MKHRFLYAILLLAIATVKAEGDVVDVGNAVGNNDLGIIVKRDDPGNRGRSINDADDHSGDEKLNTILENNLDDNQEGNSTNITTTTTTAPSTNDPSSSSSSNPNDPSSSSSNPNDPSSSSSNPNDPSSSSSNPNDPSSSSTTPSSTTNPPPPTKEDFPYQVHDENGTACILSKMSILFTVTYNTTNNETNKKTMTVPNNATSDGECSETISKMILTWPSEKSYYEDESVNFANENNIIEFTFNNSENRFWLEQINGVIYLDKDNFPNATESKLELKIKQNLAFFTTAKDSKFVCNVETVFESSDQINLRMIVESLIAYNDNNDISSKSETKCPGYVESASLTESADVGAIVGGIIGALAVIGIVGFVIWQRRRNNSTVRSEVA